MGDEGIDPAILREFKRAVQRGGRQALRGRFASLVDEMGRKRSIPAQL